MPFYLLSDLKPFWDPEILNLIDGIKAQLSTGGLVSVSLEIAAVLSLIYISIKAYAMMVGEGKLEVMTLFRPFIITLVIVNFSTYVNIVSWPGNAAGNGAKDKFTANAQNIDLAMDTKDELYNKTFQILINLTNTMQAAKANPADPNAAWWDKLGNSISSALQSEMDDIQNHITMVEQLIWMKLTMWTDDLISNIVLGIFKGIAYCLFFVQMIIQHVLICLGPLAFAFSIAGGFKENWASWTARYIAVTFYTYIGFLILNISGTIILYGANQEISRLTQLLTYGSNLLSAGTQSTTDIAMFASGVQAIGSMIGYLFIALIVAIAGIVCTPIISTWIINTAGAGSAFFGTGVKAVETAAGGAGKTAATIGKGAVGIVSGL
jgi:hypothetical protein